MCARNMESRLDSSPSPIERGTGRRCFEMVVPVLVVALLKMCLCVCVFAADDSDTEATIDQPKGARQHIHTECSGHGSCSVDDAFEGFVKRGFVADSVCLSVVRRSSSVDPKTWARCAGPSIKSLGRRGCTTQEIRISALSRGLAPIRKTVCWVH